MNRQVVVKATVLVAVGCTVVVVFLAGGFDLLRDSDRVEEFLTDSGPWGPIVYVLAFVALQPLSLPGAVLIIPATFVWSWWEVALYSLVGGMLASTAGFALSRWIARDWIEQRLPDRLRPWEQRLADHGLVATIGLRLVTGYAPAADWLLGVSRVSISAFLIGTAVGLAPSTLVMAIWGDDAARGIVDEPLVGVAVLAGVLVVGYVLYRLRQRSLPRG